MGSNIGTLFASIGLDVAELERDLRRAQEGFTGLSKSTKKILDEIGTSEERLKRETKAFQQEINALANDVQRAQAQLKVYQSSAGQSLLRERAALQREIDKTIKQAGASTNEANSGLAEMKSLLGGIAAKAAAITGVSVGLAALGSFVTTSLQEWAEQEKALNRLAFTARRFGLDTTAIRSGVVSLSNSFMRQTGVADELITEGYNRLIIAGYDLSRSTEIMRTALDLSAQTGSDLGSVLDALIKGGAGSTMQVNRLAASLGIAVDEGTPLSELLDAINQKVGGAAQAQMAGYAGAVTILATEWKEFKENVGKGLVETFGGPLVSELGMINRLMAVTGKDIFQVWDFFNRTPRDELRRFIEDAEWAADVTARAADNAARWTEIVSHFGQATKDIPKALAPVFSRQDKMKQLSGLEQPEAQFRLRDLTPDTTGIKRILAETAAIEARTKAIAKDRAEVEAHQRELEAWRKTWEGWLDSLSKDARMIAETMATAFEDNFFKVMEGEFRSLQDFVKSIIADITRMIEQQLAQQLAQSLTKLIVGGGDTIGPVISDQGQMDQLFGLATGGLVTSPTLALIGESGPEAVVPLGRMNDPSFWEGIGVGNYNRGGDTIHVTMNVVTPDLPTFRASQSQIMADIQVRAGQAFRRNR